MKREEFKNWLINDYKNGMAKTAAESRVSNAQKVENVFGDLDMHYDKDRLQSVLLQLQYSQGETRPLPKGIEIEGSYVNGMASLRQGVKRYFNFRNSK